MEGVSLQSLLDSGCGFGCVGLLSPLENLLPGLCTSSSYKDAVLDARHVF